LEVGTGFHPELTGRENIYMNGSILGMSRREIASKFDEIVDFSGIEDFLDTPVKRYSSGMYVRLAFAVAAHLEPEILIVDEVLAVGDAGFQKKCLGKMRQIAGHGRTVLFVSHNMPAVRSLCGTALLFDEGRLQRQAEPAECINYYLTNQQPLDGADNWIRPSSLERKALSLMSVSLELRGNQPELTLTADIGLLSTAEHPAAFIALDITDAFGTVIMQALPRTHGFIKPPAATQERQEHSVTIDMTLPPLIPGTYFVTAWLGTHYTATIEMIERVGAFTVLESPNVGRSFPHSPSHGYISPVSTVSYTHSAT
jgi:lipopolysaccharide transport system ATP-binding protein